MERVGFQKAIRDAAFKSCLELFMAYEFSIPAAVKYLQKRQSTCGHRDERHVVLPTTYI